MIRMWIICRPNARAAVDAALVAAGLPSEVAWVQWPQPATRDAAMPAARFFWCGWQGSLATAQAIRAALAGVPGWRAFRGAARGLEADATEADDDTAEPDPTTDRVTRRAAMVIAARQLLITLGGTP